jgi:hypothetical protein
MRGLFYNTYTYITYVVTIAMILDQPEAMNINACISELMIFIFFGKAARLLRGKHAFDF